MKIQYLGTGAAERVPAIFCQCELCQYARIQGGKEIRTQMQTVIDDGKLLIDFPGDSYLHQLQHHIDFNELEYLLLTHWHSDHFYAEDLALRMTGYGQQLDKVLHVYGSAYVKQFYDRAFKLEGRFDESRLVYHTLRAYQEVEIGPYRIYPIPAQHGNFEEDCLIFAIQHQEENKALFYVHDSGIPNTRDLLFLSNKGMIFDLVSLDCTGQGQENSGAAHMSLQQNLILIEKMKTFNLVHDETRYIASHFSHNGGLMYEAMKAMSEVHGIVTSYDGMVIEY